MIPGLSCAALDIAPLGVAGKNAPRERPRSNTKAWAHANTHNRSIRTLDLALRRRHCVLIQIFHLWLSRRNWMGFVLSQRRSRSRSSKASNGSAATLVECNFGCQANCGLARPGPAREEAGGRLVVEAACSSHHLPCIWAALRKRQRDVSEEAKEFAKKAQQRCTTFHGWPRQAETRQRSSTAVGRELLGFSAPWDPGRKRGVSPLSVKRHVVAHMRNRHRLPCFVDDILPIRTLPIHWTDPHNRTLPA
jgi:hypothetical protein